MNFNDYNDKIVVDDTVEIKYDENINNSEQRTYTYSNNGIQKSSVVSLAFSKKYIALTFSTISIIFCLFMRFLAICGVTSRAFFGIWFFLTAGLAGTSFVLNIINFAKNKKIDFNVSSVITFLAIILLFLV